MLCFFPRRGCQECQNYVLSSLVSGSVFLFWSAFQSRVSGGAGGEWDAKTRMAGREEESSMSGQNPVETLASQVHANEDSGINIPAILPTESHRHTHTHTHQSFSPPGLQNERKWDRCGLHPSSLVRPFWDFNQSLSASSHCHLSLNTVTGYSIHPCCRFHFCLI